SNNFEVSVVAAVWFDFYFQGNLLLHTGTKLIGTAATGKSRDRILVTFDKVVFPDGRSMPINSTPLSSDGTVGIPGFLIGNYLLQELIPVLLEATKAATQSLKDQITTANALTGQAQQTDTNSPKNAFLNSSGAAMGKIQELIAQDLEENKPYVLVPAGT